jgi:hypothetical protein
VVILHNVKNNYKGIAFCESWKEGNKTFEQFKKELRTSVFAVLGTKGKIGETFSRKKHLR